MNGEELIVYALVHIFTASFLKELGFFILLKMYILFTWCKITHNYANLQVKKYRITNIL